jgi:protein-tyrosine phosphatase
MIDLHSHILAGLDDGARTMEDSLRMCLIGFQDGIRTIVATPHTLSSFYRNDREGILDKVQDLNAALVRSGHQILDDKTGEFQSGIRVLPGADVHLGADILQQIDAGQVLTVADRGTFLLLEFPFNAVPPGTEEILFQLMARGITPIISHPERNLEIGRNPRRYGEMIRLGCLGQVTAMSLTGGFGPVVQRLSEVLLKRRLVHLIASDAHSPNKRPPILSSGVQSAARIIGKKAAWKMVTDYPRAVLEGRRMDIPELTSSG